MLDVTFREAVFFLPPVILIGLWVAWSDMARMLIPNKAVAALLATFVVLGFFALPSLNEYLWRYAHIAVVLAVGIAIYALGGAGAGDAKYAAAAAPFFALGDVGKVLMLFAACLLGGYLLHRIARGTFGRRLAPDWKSWQTGRRFPMGFPLAATLVIYLCFGLISPV